MSKTSDEAYANGDLVAAWDKNGDLIAVGKVVEMRGEFIAINPGSEDDPIPGGVIGDKTKADYPDVPWPMAYPGEDTIKNGFATAIITMSIISTVGASFQIL